jgi:hypothetical protein
MSPLPPSTSPSVSALGLSNYLQVKEVNETQPQVKEVSTFQQQRQVELDDWWKYRKDHEPVPFFQPGRSSSSVNEVNSFQQQRQAELDDWWKYRKAHEVPFKALAEVLGIDGTPHQSTEDCTESPPYSPLGSPTPSLDVMLSTLIPSKSPKSSTSSPFSATLSPRSVEENVMTELMLDMIYRSKNAKKKGKVTRTMSFDGEEFELESRGSVSDSEKANVSRIAQIKATVKERLRKMPASLAQRKSEQSNQSKSSSGKQSLVSHLSKRLRGAKKQEP